LLQKFISCFICQIKPNCHLTCPINPLTLFFSGARSHGPADKEYLKCINLFFGPGASLGRARPNARALDTKGHPWIAKFPSIEAEKDEGAWEMVTNILASEAGLTIAEGLSKKLKTNCHTFPGKRFDRNKKGERLHFISAMTLLGYMEGAGSDSGVSYLELTKFIVQQGADVHTDLEELW
jgi:serine/threonine-protein kinase HipA